MLSHQETEEMGGLSRIGRNQIILNTYFVRIYEIREINVFAKTNLFFFKELLKKINSFLSEKTFAMLGRDVGQETQYTFGFIRNPNKKNIHVPFQ